MRNYGAEIYAEYSLVFNCLSVVGMFCYSWVGHSYIRFHTTHAENIDLIYSNYLKKSFFAGAACFCIISLLATHTDYNYLLITVPVFFFLVQYNFNLIKTQANQMAGRVALAETLRTSVAISIPLLAIFFFHNSSGLFVLFVSLLAAYGAGCYYLLTSNKSNSTVSRLDNTDIGMLKEKIKNYGIPTAFFVSISLALTVNDRYLIAHIIDYKKAGNYAAVYDILNKGINFACAPVMMTFFPHIVKKFNDGHTSDAYNSLKNALLLEAGIFVAGLAVLILFGKFFLGFLLRQQITEDIVQIAYVLYTGLFIWQAAMLVHKPLELRLQTKYMAIIAAAVFVINVGANWFLLREYKNIMVAAWTTLASSTLYLVLVLFVIFFKKKISW